CIPPQHRPPSALLPLPPLNPLLPLPPLPFESQIGRLPYNEFTPSSNGRTQWQAVGECVSWRSVSRAFDRVLLSHVSQTPEVTLRRRQRPCSARKRRGTRILFQLLQSTKRRQTERMRRR
ncbi:hypothetical protein PFISCL1PPCAC_7451, partial [Pristionchus fissidentatus]